MTSSTYRSSKLADDSLRNFLTQRVQTPEQQKYLWRLLGYKYKIVYWLGKHNVVVDALSRREEPTPPSTLLQLLSTPISNLVNKVNVNAALDMDYQPYRSSIHIDPARFKDLSIRRDLLLHRDAIVVSFDNNIRHDIFDEGNSSTIGGHSDEWCTISRIFHSFYWHEMIEDVKRWLWECSTFTFHETTEIASTTSSSIKWLGSVYDRLHD